MLTTNSLPVDCATQWVAVMRRRQRLASQRPSFTLILSYNTVRISQKQHTSTGFRQHSSNFHSLCCVVPAGVVVGIDNTKLEMLLPLADDHASGLALESYVCHVKEVTLAGAEGSVDQILFTLERAARVRGNVVLSSGTASCSCAASGAPACHDCWNVVCLLVEDCTCLCRHQAVSRPAGSANGCLVESHSTQHNSSFLRYACTLSAIADTTQGPLLGPS